MKQPCINTLSYTILAGLFIFAFTIIYQGPFKAVLKNENTFVQTTISSIDLVDPLKWPILTICKNPCDKNSEKFMKLMTKSKNRSFANQTEFEKLIKESYFTKPNDFVFAIGLGSSYRASLEKNNTVFPQHPYVTATWIDIQYMGFCTDIYFEELRTWIVSWLSIIVTFCQRWGLCNLIFQRRPWIRRWVVWIR